MATRRTSNEEVTELLALYTELYRNNPWFFGAYEAIDDLGRHIDLHVDVEAMKADGYAIPGAPNGVKTCVFNGRRRKVTL